MEARKDSLGFLLIDVTRLMRRAFARRLEGSSLTLTQARALVYVSRHEGVRQVVLADALEIKPITMARLIDKLAASGLIERRPDPTDRRAYQIYLTPAAAAHLSEIGEVIAAIREDAFRDLSDQQAEAVSAALLKMRDNLS
jgi:DNA-binding MarR family transcriptional regulator